MSYSVVAVSISPFLHFPISHFSFPVPTFRVTPAYRMHVWWPSPTSRPQRDRPCSALCPQCFRSLSALLFPQHLRSVTALKLSPHTVPAVFPQSFRTVPATFPRCFRSSRIFLNFFKCLPSVTIDNRAGFPALLSIVSRDYISA